MDINQIHDKDKIINELGLKDDIIGIIPYGSRVYGTFNDKSDYDYIIITKGSLLYNGGFKSNAISSKDYMIQGVLYSRSGFMNGVNEYDISIWECISMDENLYVYSTNFFKKFLLNKKYRWDEKLMIKNIIKKASDSRHIAIKQFKNGYIDSAKKGIFHSIRILEFGIQLKKYRKIIDYSVSNNLYNEIKLISNDSFNIKDFDNSFNILRKRLKG